MPDKTVPDITINADGHAHTTVFIIIYSPIGGPTNYPITNGGVILMAWQKRRGWDEGQINTETRLAYETFSLSWRNLIAHILIKPFRPVLLLVDSSDDGLRWLWMVYTEQKQFGISMDQRPLRMNRGLSTSLVREYKLLLCVSIPDGCGYKFYSGPLNNSNSV